MIYRRANENDLPDLLRIEDECFGMERFSTEVVLAFIVRVDAFTIVAQDDEADKLVGSAACLISEDSGEGRIASIAVLKDYREQGVGSNLLERCEEALRGHRLAKYVLEVETTNIPAIMLYMHRGYLNSGILKDYYGAGRDAFAMEKRTNKSRRLTVR